VTLKHLGLCDIKVRSQPKVKLPSVTILIDYSDSQVPFSAPSFYPDPDYPTDYNRISKPPWVTSMVWFLLSLGRSREERLWRLGRTGSRKHSKDGPLKTSKNFKVRNRIRYWVNQ
jgi:hypothetical protein